MVGNSPIIGLPKSPSRSGTVLLLAGEDKLDHLDYSLKRNE
jgi:hypothetical protein